MPVRREGATAFAEGYRRTWEGWDPDGFADLFSDDMIYVEHPVDENVIGGEAIRYVPREHAETGTVGFGTCKPIVEGKTESWPISGPR